MVLTNRNDEKISWILPKEQLLENARAQAAKAPDEYTAIVELYYFVRYFVSVFEARQNAIPIQVWNEYRNALDHFIRHLTKQGLSRQNDGSGYAGTEQLKYMQGHIQRAALDVLKLFCHGTDEWYKKNISCEDERVLDLVNDGEFTNEIDTLYSSAERLFLEAKTQDGSLGEDAKHNKQIVGRYLDAAFAYEDLRSFLRSNRKNISAARRKYNQVFGAGTALGNERSIAEGIKANILSNFIWYLLVLAVGWVLGKAV